MATRTLVSFDWAVKKLLRKKADFRILNGFFSKLLKQHIMVVELLESESNRETANQKLNRADLLCKNSRDEILVIEIQFYEEADCFHRCLYQTSKIITEYLVKGEQYAKIKKVYSVNILYFDLGHGQDYIYHGKTDFIGFHLGDGLSLSASQQKKFGKQLPSELFPEHYLVKVNNFNDVAKSTLDEWIYYLKKTTLTGHYTAQGLDLVAEELKYDNMDAKEKREYNRYLRKFKILENVMETAMLKGEMIGIEKGIELGKVEGKTTTQVEVVLSGHANGLSTELLARVTGLSEAEVLAILKAHGKMD